MSLKSVTSHCIIRIAIHTLHRTSTCSSKAFSISSFWASGSLYSIVVSAAHNRSEVSRLSISARNDSAFRLRVPSVAPISHAIKAGIPVSFFMKNPCFDLCLIIRSKNAVEETQKTCKGFSAFFSPICFLTASKSSRNAVVETAFRFWIHAFTFLDSSIHSLSRNSANFFWAL